MTSRPPSSMNISKTTAVSVARLNNTPNHMMPFPCVIISRKRKTPCLKYNQSHTVNPPSKPKTDAKADAQTSYIVPPSYRDEQRLAGLQDAVKVFHGP